MKTIQRGSTDMNVSAQTFTIKQIGEPEERILRFIGSDETPDRDGDVISVEGWDLKNYRLNPVFLWAHDYSIPPVGKAINVGVKGKKLMFEIQFPEKGIYPFADLVYNLYKGGFLNATSVGFVGKQAAERDDKEAEDAPPWQVGVKFTQQELLELSAVPVPSNPQAVQQAKSLGAVTDDEYNSLMSFINGDFVNGDAHIGSKTVKGISQVYSALHKSDDTSVEPDKEPAKQEPGITEEDKEVNVKMTEYSFVKNTKGRTLLVDEEKGAILGDVTDALGALLAESKSATDVEPEVKGLNVQEKAGAALSKQNKSRLSQAKDLIIEVLGETEKPEEEVEPEAKGEGDAVLPDEEELTDPKDTDMKPQKSAKPEPGKEDDEEGEDDEEDDEEKPSEKKSVEDEQDDLIEFDF